MLTQHNQYELFSQPEDNLDLDRETMKAVGSTTVIPVVAGENPGQPLLSENQERYLSKEDFFFGRTTMKSQFRDDIPNLIEEYPKISKGVIECVQEGLGCLLEIYFLYGLKRPRELIDRDFRKTKIYFSPKEIIYKQKIYNQVQKAVKRMLNYLTIHGELEWVSYFKFKCCNFYAFYETNSTDLVPPISGMETDIPHTIFGGIIRKFQRKLRLHDNKKFLSFILSINMAKMGMPRPGKDFVERAVKKTQKHLTTEPSDTYFNSFYQETLPRYPEVSLGFFKKEEIMLNEATFKFQLERTIDEMFEGIVYTNKIHYEPFFPSIKSNYQETMQQGGGVKAIYANIFRGKPQFKKRVYIREFDQTLTIVREPVIKTDKVPIVLSEQQTS